MPDYVSLLAYELKISEEQAALIISSIQEVAASQGGEVEADKVAKQTSLEVDVVKRALGVLVLGRMLNAKFVTKHLSCGSVVPDCTSDICPICREVLSEKNTKVFIQFSLVQNLAQAA